MIDTGTIVWLLCVNTAMCMLFVIAGFIMGRMSKQVVPSKEEAPPKEVKIPNPIKAYKEYKERQEEDREREIYEIIMENVERYDGTGEGQKDVPIM